MGVLVFRGFTTYINLSSVCVLQSTFILHHISGAEGAWTGDISCVGEYFQPKGPILKGLIRGQYPSHWVATKRSDREVDVHGLVTLMVEGGGTYTAHVHEYIKFWEPCVTINRHFWKVSEIIIPLDKTLGLSG